MHHNALRDSRQPSSTEVRMQVADRDEDFHGDAIPLVVNAHAPIVEPAQTD